MEEFKNINVVRKANVYFDGGVSSRTLIFPDGSKKTLGFMIPGEYEFGTSQHETMEMLGGSMEVLLPGAEQWKSFKEGDVFEVEANTSFKVKVDAVADYCCSYR